MKTACRAQWAEVFSTLMNGGGPETGRLDVQEKFRQLGRLTTAVASDTELSDYKEASVVKLITAYRIRGHEAADLNPLGEPHHEPVADLDPAFHGLDSADLDQRIRYRGPVRPGPDETARYHQTVRAGVLREHRRRIDPHHRHA